jgi:hypothetical protein
MLRTNIKHPSSFRDPSGHIFVENDTIFRRINASYFQQFTTLSVSGLYETLTRNGLLISHEIIEQTADYKIIRPEHLDLITYPYEWSFSQLKDAALLTLEIHQTALKHGMVLKDATAFNVQFHKGKPIFIDTLSFDIYKDGDPWTAYGQFCRHFLIPLLLMKYIAPDLNKLQMCFLDGVPVEVASTMLPAKTHFSPFITANIHMHAKAHRKYKDTFATKSNPRLALRTHNNILMSMVSYIKGLKLKSQTEWSEYYGQINYADKGFKFKEDTVHHWINKHALQRIWDIGGNDGHFARLIQDSCEIIVCTDLDPVAVDANYRATRQDGAHKIVPLMVDYTNPSPGLGFSNKERADFFTRMEGLQIDCILALALIHHLSISANCTFEMLAASFSQTADFLLIEFVDPTDSWADKLLGSKRSDRDLFGFYNRQNFETVFSKYYDFLETAQVPMSKRTLYMMSRKAD